MARSRETKIELTAYDDLFQTDESREEAKLSKIRDIPISEIDEFPDHPFKVLMDEDMEQLVESIKRNGVMTPATVRLKEDGRYELISGHRRKKACELAGLETLKCEVKELTRDEAIIVMVESNLQRSVILPSEKAFAYKMRLEAMKRQAGRPPKENASPLATNLSKGRSDEELGELVGESKDQIRRYIRLTELVPEILQMVDERQIAFRPAVEVSYLTEEQQYTLLEAMEYNDATPSLAQAIKMKKYLETVQELLEAKEGEHVQFKEAKKQFDSREAAKCCCALANNGGGKLVFGITDKRPRSVVGSAAFDQPERTRMGLIEKLKVNVDFQLFNYEGKRVLVFDVKSRAIGLPVQYDGVAWIYEGDTLKPMPEDMRRSIYEETGGDFSGTICAGATVDDLDETAIENFRAKWIEKSGKKQLATLSKEQLLHDCGAITDDGVTYAALILFGKNAAIIKYLPQAEIIFEYRSSEASGPANQREEFKVGFFACYDRVWELVNLRNDKQHYQEGFFVFDIATFNERVVREAILNAVSHRNYQFGGSIFVRQFRDRLVVESPGGLPFGITLDNILDRQLPRNRRIAEILSLCGMVERSGQGMNLMFELSVQEAKPLPDFTGTDDFFVSVTLNGLILDKAMLSVINRISERGAELLSTEDFLVIDALYHERPLNEKMQSRLNRLIEMGIVEHIGRKKYVLARSLYAATGKTGVHTRHVGLDRDTNKELLLKHIRQNNEVGTPFKELQQVLPGLNRNQIQVLMRELKEVGKVVCKGKTSAARWFIIK